MRARSLVAVRIGMPPYSLRFNRWLSPETMASARAASAQASTWSSSGSARMTGAITAGFTKVVNETYSRTNCPGPRPTRRICLANLSRFKTFSSSVSSARVVNSSMRPVWAASRTRRGAPRQNIPETTVLVSATTRTICAPRSADGLNLGLDLRVGHSWNPQVSQTICGLKESLGASSPDFFAEQTCDGLRPQEASRFSLLCKTIGDFQFDFERGHE